MDRDGRSRIARTYDPPMLLALDIGNTNLTLGLVDGGELRSVRRAATGRSTTADELELLLEGLLGLDQVALADLDGISLGSVVPAQSSLVEAVTRRRGIRLLVASAGTVPVAVRIDRPGEVGADRLVNALAVQRLYGAPAVVVDFGTATTFDAIGSDGAYLGGAIAPGLNLGIEALATRTAKLPRVDLRAPASAIGRDTVGAIQAGAVLGHQAMAAGLLARIRREVAELAGVEVRDVRGILTGGLSAAAWAREIEGVDVIDPDLTLKGLAILYSEVAGGEPLAAAR
jgi:type III pantothenate kinase